MATSNKEITNPDGGGDKHQPCPSFTYIPNKNISHPAFAQTIMILICIHR